MTHTHRRNIAVVASFALIFAATLTLMGQSYNAPRTPWGDPDLQGTYTNSNESGISMEKPAEFAGKTGRRSHVGAARRVDHDASRAAAEDGTDHRRLDGERHWCWSSALV
jgi:hypothetical protein